MGVKPFRALRACHPEVYHEARSDRSVVMSQTCLMSHVVTRILSTAAAAAVQYSCTGTLLLNSPSARQTHRAHAPACETRQQIHARSTTAVYPIESHATSTVRVTRVLYRHVTSSAKRMTLHAWHPWLCTRNLHVLCTSFSEALALHPRHSFALHGHGGSNICERGSRTRASSKASYAHARRSKCSTYC